MYVVDAVEYKVISVSIKNRKVVIIRVAILDDEEFNVSLTACMSSSLGKFVYSDRTSIVTRMASLVISFLMFDILFNVSAESLVNDLSLTTNY